MQKTRKSNFSIQVNRPAPDRLAAKLEGLLDSLFSRKQVHHAVMALENGDRSFRWIGAAGEAQPGGEPMRESTPFFMASVTKLYIAAAILKLYEQAKVGLDNSITEYLPESLVSGIHRWNGVDYTEQITIRHLLNHTSGLPDWLEDHPKGERGLLEQVAEEEDRLIGIEEAMEYVRNKLVPHFPPAAAGEQTNKNPLFRHQFSTAHCYS